MRRVERLFPVSVALITLCVFLTILQNDFVNWDDPRNFLMNQAYRGLGWTQLHWMWATRFFNHYAPLTWMTLGLDYTIWGMDPAGYHLTSLLFHVANAVVFYFVALALLRIARGASAATPWCAAFAALLFAVHPLRAEPVAWASNRLEVVSGFFFLLALLVYLKRKPIVWTLVFFILAVLSKETAIVLPAVLLILDAYPLKRLGRQPGPWIEKIPFALAGIVALAPAVLSSNRHANTSEAFAGLPVRLALAAYSFAFYVWKSVVPAHLAPFYPLTAHRVDPHGLPLQLSAVVLILTAAAAVMFRRRFPALGAAALAYAVILIPVSGLFSDSEHIAADRYSYLACLGWAVLAGGCMTLAWNRWRATSAAAAALLIVTLSWLSFRQAATWKDSETLWSHAVAVEPSSLAFDMLGQARLDQSNMTGAIEAFRQAIGMNPDSASPHNHMGGALLGINDWEDAAAEFQEAIRLQPDLAGAHNGWGYALMMQGRPREAIAHFQRALQLEPKSANVRENLQRALAMQDSSGRP